jgi:hypothetical protein
MGKSKMKITHEKEILKPPETVFPWVADPQKAMKWQKDVKGGKIVVQEKEIVGTTFTEIIEEDGGRLEMHGTITEYCEGKVVGFHLNSRIHEFDVRYVLEEEGGSTKFSIQADIKWKFPMNILSLIIGKKMKEGLLRQLVTETDELKRLCEAE